MAKLKIKDIANTGDLILVGLVLNFLLVCAIWIAMNAGLDPLNLSPNGYDDIHVQMNEIGEDGVGIVSTEMSFDDFVDLFKTNTGSALLKEEEREELANDFIASYIERNTVIYGQAKVVSIRKLDHNYEVRLMLREQYKKIDTIILWIPFGKQDDEVVSLRGGQIVKFSGELRKFQYLDSHSIVSTSSGDKAFVLKNAEVMK